MLLLVGLDQRSYSTSWPG